MKFNQNFFFNYFAPFLFAVSSIIPNLFGMDQTEITIKDNKFELIRQRLSSIAFPKLVLGVRNNEEDLSTRFTEDYFFLDSFQPSLDSRSIKADFNNLEDLEILNKELGDTCDMIVLDDSTFKFTNWVGDHLRLLKGLLKSGGKFIFAPLWDNCGISFYNQQWPEYEIALSDIDKIIKDEAKLINTFNYPYNFKIVDNRFEELIDQRLEIYFEFKKAPEEEWEGMMFKHGFMPSDILLNKWRNNEISINEIKDLVTQEVYTKQFRSEAWSKIVNNIILKITKDIFGENNVKMSNNQPLPFPSHWSENQEYLIEAIKE